MWIFIIKSQLQLLRLILILICKLWELTIWLINVLMFCKRGDIGPHLLHYETPYWVSPIKILKPTLIPLTTKIQISCLTRNEFAKHMRWSNIKHHRMFQGHMETRASCTPLIEGKNGQSPLSWTNATVVRIIFHFACCWNNWS